MKFHKPKISGDGGLSKWFLIILGNYRSLSLEGKGKIGNFRIYVTSENAKPVDVFVKTDEVSKEIKIVDDWSLF